MKNDRKKIVFVQPPLTHKERYGIRYRSGGETQPLGLASLAAITRKSGYETAIVDAEALRLNSFETAKIILSYHPDFVGFTAVTISIFNASKVAEFVKNENNKIRCIIGGHHFTALPDNTMERFPSFDIGIKGEGEVAIIELLNTLEGGGNTNDLNCIDGIVFRSDDKCISTRPHKRIMDLDSLPMPAWDLLPKISSYYRPPIHTIKKFPACNLVTSRGCPGQCIFCDRCVYGNTTTFYSATYVMEMIKDLYLRYGIREIQFRDDNFVVFHKRLLELCDLLVKENLDLSWTCLGRVDHVDPEILKAMRRAGCWQIWYGIESGSQKILDIIKKNITIDHIKQAIDYTKNADISACGTFIIGNPGESAETVKDTMNFAIKLNIDDFHVSFMTPFPGSELYRRAGEFGTFENNWQKLNGWEPLFIPHGLQKEDLYYWSKCFFRRFYFRLRIILNYVKRVKSFKHFGIYASGLFALFEWIFKRRT